MPVEQSSEPAKKRSKRNNSSASTKSAVPSKPPVSRSRSSAKAKPPVVEKSRSTSTSAKTKISTGNFIRKRGQAPVMSDTESDKDMEEPTLNTDSNQSQKQAAKDDQEDEYDEGHESDGDQLEDERGYDQEAVSHFADETPVFMSSWSNSRCRGSAADDNDLNDFDNNATSDFASHPATSDGEGFTSSPAGSDEEEEEEEEAVPRKPAPKKANKQARLVEELPIIAQPAPSLSITTSTSTNTANGSVEWLPHSDIVLLPHTDQTQAFKIAIKPQSKPIHNVINRAEKIAQLKLIFDDTFNPFTSEGIAALCLASLIQAAEELGYDDSYDIAHRLEDVFHTGRSIPDLKSKGVKKKFKGFDC
ncbi:hypothetical protein K435DRAFT_873090 [Dendrothele bispora CBS 962.96]|uniref:Uncharacterized protein n=1 Tax=Dendrothele bispora (strain CBS 962.96) TaxID=1314807 RepID=A0A4S8KZY4_DENBC|nr:hypothetical protein K435DRAFT_873090 [Dendrothele bispora CBS 962.96]